MKPTVQPGDYVAWKWGFGMASGVVVEVVPDKISIESKGKIISRNGTPEDPAVVIQHSSGGMVLKRAHELQHSTD